MKITEVTTPTPEQARLKSMKDRVKRDQEAIKAERARQQVNKGKEMMNQVRLKT
jgi:hypothetical protein